MNSLQGLHILVTRPEPHGTELCIHINNLGGRGIGFPTIEFTPPPNSRAFHQAIQKIIEQDWLIFISPQAVYASIVNIRKAWPALPETVKFAAVGAGTAKALLQAGYHTHVIPAEWNSEGLLATPEFQDIRNKKVAVIRGDGGREKIDAELTARGAKVLPVIAYQRVMPKTDISECLNLLKNAKIDAIVCTSFEGVKNLKLMLGEVGFSYARHLPILVMSERIKELAQDLGFQTIWVTANASNDAVLDLLATMRK